MGNENARVIFQPSGRRGEVPKGITIIEASRLMGKQGLRKVQGAHRRRAF